MAHRPNALIVAVAWVKGVDGIDATKVASSVPRDKSVWATTGFIQVGPIVGGTPDPHVRQRDSVVEISCHAVNPNSIKPPWGKANTLAELVIEGTYGERGGGRNVSALLPSGYDGARVQTAYPTSEPREFDSPDNTVALYKFELTINWTVLT